jgi:hypothetical protein
MKYLYQTLFLIVFLSLNLFAQSDWHTYPVRSVAEIIALNPAESSEKADIIISANPFPSKTTVIYMGKSRPISEDTKNFIGLWVQTRNVSPENANLLVEEFLFREKDREYWIPVITRVSPVFKRDLKEGDELIVYYFFLGGYNPKKLQEKGDLKGKSLKPVENKVQWIFAVEAFQKSAYKTRLLTEAIDKKLEYSSDKTDFLIDTRQVKSKSKVIYTGEVRNASEKKILFLKRWIEKNDMPLGIAQLLYREARFREGDKDYWLPIRESILEEMQGRLKKGDAVEIHTILAGGIPQKDFFEWVFVVGEFTR